MGIAHAKERLFGDIEREDVGAVRKVLEKYP
jgi:hypothetical protein